MMLAIAPGNGTLREIATPGSAGTLRASDHHIQAKEYVMATPIVPLQRQMPTDCPCGVDHRPIIRAHYFIADDCWQWTGTVDKDGYGTVSHHRAWRAHRLSYIAFRGTIPAGMVIDHLCRNRACVNPDHLEAVTGRENVLRSEGIAARNARKTHCPKGHAEWGNVGTGRYCMACARESQARKIRERSISNDPSDPRHGTTNGYGNLGCRCGDCRKANADAHREYMQRRRAALRQVS